MIPLVVVLDLDGTIIGDITPQIVSWEICNDIKSSGGGNFYKPKDLYAKLQGGIIRPYFAEFIKSLKKNIPNIEFFIFTASEKKWAMNIIGYIEKHAISSLIDLYLHANIVSWLIVNIKNASRKYHLQ